MSPKTKSVAAIVAFAILCLAHVAAGADAETFVKRSFAALDRGDTEKDPARQRDAYQAALADAERAVRLDDANADAHYALFCSLGRITERRGPLGQLLGLPRLKRELDRTLELDSSHSEALAAKGEMLLRLPSLLGGDAAEAEQYLRRSLVHDPTFWRARILLVQALLAQSRRDAAAAEARDILAQIDPHRPERAEALQLLAEMRVSPTPAATATP